MTKTTTFARGEEKQLTHRLSGHILSKKKKTHSIKNAKLLGALFSLEWFSV